MQVDVHTDIDRDRHSHFDWSLWLKPTVRLVAAMALVMMLVAPSVAFGQMEEPGVQRAVDGGALEALLFWIFAIAIVGSGLGVALSKNVVRMALSLFAALGAVACVYFLLAANFVGAIQLIVYAGGTLVLLIFGVMLTSKSPWVRFEPKRSEVVTAGIICILLACGLITILSSAHWPEQRPVAHGVALHSLGKELLTTYLVPFEVASVLLLVVMIGAAYLARQEGGK